MFEAFLHILETYYPPAYSEYLIHHPKENQGTSSKSSF